MPGIFGFYLKANKKNDKIEFLLHSMCNKLCHIDTYSFDKVILKNIGIGKVDVNFRTHRKNYFDPQTNIVLSLYGNIFDYINLDESIDFDKENEPPENAVVKIYQRYGARTGEKLNGDFNLTIYDPKKDRLLIFNDRFGFRHLYYYEDDNIFLFAPEIKGFLAFNGFDKTLDEQGLSDYFNYFYHLGNRTNFKNVKLLPPASCISVDSNGLSLRSYWTPRYTNDIRLETIEDATKTGYELFLQSMQRRLKGRRSILVPLSGGLDSRLIVAVAKLLDYNITSATFGIAGCLEHEIAKKVCKVLSIREPHLVSIEEDWIYQYGSQLTWFNECNHSNLGLTTQHGFSQIMGIEYDCFLNGIFGGHLSFGSPYFTAKALNSPYAPQEISAGLFRGLDGNRYDHFLQKCATLKLNDIVNAFRFKTIGEEWQRTEKNSDVFPFRWDSFFINNRIRRGMNAIDQNRFFYDDQLPFSSYELYDFYLKLSPDITLDHRLYKAIYKRFFPKLAKVPWTSTGVNLYDKASSLTKFIRNFNHQLTWYIPRLTFGKLEFFNKYGFAAYLDAHYRRCDKTRNWINGILLSDQCMDRGYFKKSGLKNLIQKQQRGQSILDELSKMVVFEIWAQNFLD